MSSPIVAGPNTGYDFGYDFNYGLWPSHTKLTMVNVPWNSDYRDIVRFANQGALDSWVDNAPNHVIENASLQKFNTSVFINTPLNRAMVYNYIRAENGTSGVGDTVRNYYYFITNVTFIAGNNTQLTLQLDAWQTFGYEVQFGNCYVERGHIGIANTNAFDHYGRDYLTIPEGLDVGGEYRTVHVENETILSFAACDILVCSTADLTQSFGTVANPSINAATGETFQGLPSGANWYVFKTAAQFEAFMAICSTTPWISQSVISVTLIPNLTRYVPGFDYGASVTTGIGGFNFYHAYGALQGQDIPTPRVNAMAADWRDSSFISTVLGSHYAGLKKFLTYPYMVLELTTWTGSPLVIKPESWQDADATVRELAALVPPGQRIAVSPYRYNADSTVSDPSGVDDGGESVNFATFLDNFPTLPIVNNMALSYLASNKNGIAFQYTSADWSQNRAIQGAQAGADVANAGIGNTGRQAGIANNSQAEQASRTAVQASQTAMISGMTGVLGGGGNLPVVGAVTGAMNYAGQAGMIGAQLDNANTAVAARGSSAVSNIKTEATVRDTNQQYANFAAKGDYANAIGGINAKVQDARMIQPSTSGQFGGDAFNIINGQFGYSLRFKMLNVNALRTIGNYWLRYGYSVQQYTNSIPANFQVMSKFTYWKLSETYITQGAFPEMFKQTIRGIFEKGVTVWGNPADIGNTNVWDNTPVSGVTL